MRNQSAKRSHNRAKVVWLRRVAPAVLAGGMLLGSFPIPADGQGAGRAYPDRPGTARAGRGGGNLDRGGQERRPGEALTLPDALALALAAHPAVAQARAGLRAASARLEQAEATRLPWLAAHGSLALHQEPMIVAPIHSLDMSDPPDFDENLLQGAITLGYTVFDGGIRGARIRQMEAGEVVAAESGREANMAVMVQVSRAYLGILSGREVLQAAEAQRAALGAEAERVRQFLTEGRAARVDLIRVEAALSRVRASEISARSELALAEGRLARLTGVSVEAIRAARLGSVGPRVGDVPSRGEVLASAEIANPDLTRAQQNLTQASAAVREAKANWFPTLEAGGRYNNYGTLSGGHVQEWQVLVQVSYPLFSGGSRSGDQARAEAEERQASEGLRLARLQLEDEAEAALARVMETRALREAMELAVEQSEEVARIEALALEAGAGVQTDFLEAQAELFQARASLAQARHGEVLARIQLARVRGELTQDWIQENMEVEP